MGTDERQKINNPEIKSSRAKIKQAKEEFHVACNNSQVSEKITKQKAYIDAQKQIRDAIHREEAKKTEIKKTKMAEKAKIDPNALWTAKKKANGYKELEYNTITEDGEIIINAEETKSYIAQRPVTSSFCVFFDLRLNKWLNKQSWGWWFETPSCSLWRHCNVLISSLSLTSMTGRTKSGIHGENSIIDSPIQESMLNSTNQGVKTTRKQCGSTKCVVQLNYCL